MVKKEVESGDEEGDQWYQVNLNLKQQVHDEKQKKHDEKAYIDSIIHNKNTDK
jgi:hypothetical protein